MEDAERILERARTANREAVSYREALAKARRDAVSRIDAARGITAAEVPLGELAKTRSLLRILEWIRAVRTLDSALSDVPDDDDAFSSFSLYRRLRTLDEALAGSGCRRLKEYVRSVRDRWKVALTKRFKDALTGLAEELRWPESILAEEYNGPEEVEETTVDAFRRCALYLDDVVEGGEDDDAVSTLVEPLKKRFKYHFSGTRKTNALTRPEWYFRRVWKWIENAETFFHSRLSGYYRGRFAEALLRILGEKAAKDAREAASDDALFAHLIDEILSFARDLSEAGYPGGASPVVVLTEDRSVFRAWIELERKSAFEKLDSVFLDDAAWTESASEPAVSKCAARFLTLLGCMTERYRYVGPPELRLKFADLQNELLEDLRLRLVQISRQGRTTPVDDKYCLILNSAKRVITRVQGWSESPFFMKLESDLGEEEGVFFEPLSRLDFVVNDMILSLSDFVYYEAKARFRPYAFEKNWIGASNDDDDISAEALPALRILLSHLTFCSEKLLPDIFEPVLEKTAENVKNILMNDVLSGNDFSRDGCLQLETDIRKGFLPVFARYCSEEVNDILAELEDVCVLLNLTDANAALLLLALTDEKSPSKIKAQLAEFNLRVLEKPSVVNVLNRRNLDAKM